MIGFGFGGILMGRLADRFGVMVPLMVGAVGLGAGFISAGLAGSLWHFSLAQGLLLGLLGTSATFAPLVADTSLWFTRRRGIALGICMSGNYVAGAVWPPVIQHFVETRRLARHLHRHRRLLPADDAAAGAGLSAPAARPPMPVAGRAAAPRPRRCSPSARWA